MEQPNAEKKDRSDGYVYFDGEETKQFEPKQETDEYFDFLEDRWSQCGDRGPFFPRLKYRRRTTVAPMTHKKDTNAQGHGTPAQGRRGRALVMEQKGFGKTQSHNADSVPTGQIKRSRKSIGGVYTCLDCGHRGRRARINARCPMCGAKATASNTV